MPTSDWQSSEKTRKKVIQGVIESRNICKRLNRWFRLKLGLGDGVKVEGSIGFKSVRQKSLHFESSRFRENLMEISMLTEENSIIDFVRNLGDMKILFTSMSPAIVEFFDNAFNASRFTKNVRNLDWHTGDKI